MTVANVVGIVVISIAVVAIVVTIVNIIQIELAMRRMVYSLAAIKAIEEVINLHRKAMGQEPWSAQEAENTDSSTGRGTTCTGRSAEKE